MGEIQLTKRDLPSDEKVNLAAEVVNEDQSLINLIEPGYKFNLVEKGML